MPYTSKNGQLFMGDGQSRVNWYPVTLAENVYMTEGGDTVDDALDDKADCATTLAGYGITNAYTKSEVDALLSSALGNIETLLAGI